jgi:hypothetical protein
MFNRKIISSVVAFGVISAASAFAGGVTNQGVEGKLPPVGHEYGATADGNKGVKDGASTNGGETTKGKGFDG